MNNWKMSWRRLLVRMGLLPPAEVHYIGGSDTLPPPLSREREAELLARTEDEDARKELIEHNLRLVVYIARRFENTGVGIEDLISIGTIGLIKAVGTYRTDKNIKLATYASRCIENEILMYLRKNAGRKGEVSFDEPLNTDWDGNELLLSDVLGTEADVVMRPIEEAVGLVLDHIRSTVSKCECTAENGMHQLPLGGRKCLLLQIWLPKGEALIPEVSVNKYMLWMRFSRPDEKRKLHIARERVLFKLGICG